MNPLTIIRKIGKFVRGGGGVPQVLLACILGFSLGMIPGFSLTTIVLILAIVLLNVSMGLALMSFAVGKLAALILAPVTYSVGYGVIHSMGLEGLFAWAGNTPMLALLDLHVYCLTGGLIVGTLIGAVIGLVLARLIVLLRRGLVAAGQRSATVDKISRNGFVRFLLRVLFGKSKRPLSEMLEAKFPIIRTSGAIVTVVLAIILLGTPVLLADYLLANALADQLSKANGAEVNIERADIAVFSGRLAVEGLQVTDREDPQRNMMVADRLVSDISITDLLAKRVVISLVEINHLRTDVPRQTPGKLYPRSEREDEPEDTEAGPSLLDYLEDAEKYEKYLDYLQDLAEYLRRERRRQEGEPPVSQQELLALDYFDRSAAHILVKNPRLRIQKLVVDRVIIGEEEFRLEGEEISSEPALNPHAMNVRLGSLQTDGDKTVFGQKHRLFVTFAFHQADQLHGLDLLLSDVPANGLSSRVPVKVSGGLADISAKGVFSHDKLQLPFAIAVRQLQSQARPDESILGLSPEASGRLMSSINQMTLAGIIGGSLPSPRLKLDEKATLEGMKAGLTGAARAELANQIDSQLTRLGPGLKVKPDDLLKSPILPAGLLPSGLTGDKKDEQSQSNDTEDKAVNGETEDSDAGTGTGGLFDRLRRR